MKINTTDQPSSNGMEGANLSPNDHYNNPMRVHPNHVGSEQAGPSNMHNNSYHNGYGRNIGPVYGQEDTRSSLWKDV